jgi:hypothetical protein
MTPIDILIAVPLLAFFSFIWASTQTEVVSAKGYRQQSPDVWVETISKVKKPKYPDIAEPVISDTKKG